MIDFVNIRYYDKMDIEKHVLESPLFKQIYRNTEIKADVKSYPLKTNLEGMEIIIRNELAEVNGSIHKYWNCINNNGFQNNNDFSYSSFLEALESLEKCVVNSGITSLSRLELGLNIEIEDNPTSISENNVLFFKEKGFSRKEKFRGNGLMKRFISTDFDIKIYDKGRQYNLESNILRFEIVIKGKRALNKLGIYNLNSLRSKENYRYLFKVLLSKYDSLVVIDDFSKIKRKDRYELYKFTNELYWSYHIKHTSYSYKSKVRKQFKFLVAANDLLKTKLYIRNKLIKKFIYLINN